MPRPYCLRRGEGTPPYDLPEKGFVGRPALRPPQRGEGAPPYNVWVKGAAPVNPTGRPMYGLRF